MRKEDEDYFTAKMYVIADKFNAIALKSHEPLSPAHGAELQEMQDVLDKYVGDTVEEFHGKGYTSQDWGRLMNRANPRRNMSAGG